MNKLTLEKLANFAKTRAFIYPSSEIYGGLSAVYDYGHYGVLLRQNIVNEWIRSIVRERDDVTLLDSAIFMHPTTWVASGHVGGFNDPQVDCRNCKNRFRADHLLEKYGVDADKATLEFINAELDTLRHEDKLKCPVCGKKDLTEAKVFSLMVKTNLGSPTDALSEENVVYMRPETCGGIYLDYKSVLNSIHPKLPFGIAQMGKAFRNEIVARQWIFRTREFEQMEMQYFHTPDMTESKYEEWKEYRWKWYLDLGISGENLKWYKHAKLAHYASAAYDIEYNFKSLEGFKEIEGIHARGDWDLSQHQKFSGEDLTYFDQTKNTRILPHIMETSGGVNRMFMMFLDNSYTEEEVNGETRIVLKLDKRLAPIKAAILPLTKDERIKELAKKLQNSLRSKYFVEYDETQNIGKRYRRQDEIGTPFCFTVDFQSLEDNTVTVRDRDSMKQERIKIDDVMNFMDEKYS